MSGVGPNAPCVRFESKAAGAGPAGFFSWLSAAHDNRDLFFQDSQGVLAGGFAPSLLLRMTRRARPVP